MPRSAAFFAIPPDRTASISASHRTRSFTADGPSMNVCRPWTLVACKCIKTRGLLVCRMATALGPSEMRHHLCCEPVHRLDNLCMRQGTVVHFETHIRHTEPLGENCHALNTFLGATDNRA
jgi:hypothetical protein